MSRNVPAHIDQTCQFFVDSKNGVMEGVRAYCSFSRLVWCLRSSADSAVLGNRPCAVWSRAVETAKKERGSVLWGTEEKALWKQSLEDTAGRQLRKGLAESPAAEETVFEDAVCTPG